MARSAPTATVRGKGRKRKAQPALFRDRTVLFHWLLHQLGVSRWENLARPLEGSEGGQADTSPSIFAQHLKMVSLDVGRAVKDADIDRIDARIVAVTRALNDARSDEPIRWKYFQYLALFFTELYLDRYLGDRDALARELNAFLATFEGAQNPALPPYGFAEDDLDDLAKVAFWMATGSGKTLVMHANLLQYLAALERFGRPAPDHILLVTPSAGLSVQHERELLASGIKCARFEKGLQQRGVVTILEITTLREKSKEKTVAVAAFQSRVGNLVLVDEGHRGASKEDGEWRRNRRALGDGGFTFEYSATFAQAAAKDASIAEEYAKCVLMDYSYFRFFEDGYGKHWQIMNIRPGAATAKRARELEGDHLRAYLTGALVVFYQQLETFARVPAVAAEHRIEKPFCVFAGKSVTGGNEGKDEQSDMTRVMGFLATFVAESERAETERILAGILSGASEFRTRAGRNVFDLLTVLPELQRALQVEGLTAATLYRRMLDRIFNTRFTGRLHVSELKEAEGEIALSVGDAPAFGVVNVGDAPGLRKKVEDGGLGNIVVQPKAFGRSLFHGIDAPGSELTMLIGSRKFTEGWSSWRVSLMGLLNIGRGQGTQIIQLFGRGVRLRGKQMSLKRSSPRLPKTPDDQQLKVLETLSIFGVRADYMDVFEDELRAEGFEPDDEPRVETLPIVRLEPHPPLRVLRLPTTTEWKRGAPAVVLSAEVGAVQVTVDAYPRVQVRGGTGKDGTSGEHLAQGPLDCFRFVKHGELYAELVQAKALHGWSNLALPRSSVVASEGGPAEVPLTQALLAGTWYRLRIPERYVAVTSLEHRTLWQQLATELVIRYAQATWDHARNRYQTEHAKVVWLADYLADPALSGAQRRALEEALLPSTYEITIPRDGDAMKEQAVVDYVKKLAAKVRKGEFNDATMPQVLVALGLDGRHLYDPLVHVPDKASVKVKTSPVALNEGEYTFVRDLKRWLATKPAVLEGAEVHLLRNPARKGFGFKDARGFYPDFLLWVTRGSEQWLTFVDPKGVHHLVQGTSDLKVSLWQRLADIEARHGRLGVHLDAWLLSRTGATDPTTPQALLPFQDNHIVWQDPGARYIPALFAAVLAPR